MWLNTPSYLAVVILLVVVTVRLIGVQFNEYILCRWKFNHAITQNPNLLQYVLYRT